MLHYTHPFWYVLIALLSTIAVIFGVIFVAAVFHYYPHSDVSPVDDSNFHSTFSNQLL